MTGPAAAGPPPPGPPPTFGRPPRRRRGGVIGPLLLVLIGAVLLLQNAGWLPADAWANLWRLWPLVLVLAGLELLLSHRLHWLALAGLVAVVLAVGVGLVTAPRSPLAADTNAATISRSAQTPLGGANQAAVAVRFGAGELTLGTLADAQPDQLALMTYSGPAPLLPRTQYSVSDGVGHLEYGSGSSEGPNGLPFMGGSEGQLEIDLAPQVPITSLAVQTGATSVHLDLSSLQVSNVDLSVGATSTWLRLPENAGQTSVHIRGGASSISLEIPDGVAAQISERGGLSTFTIDQSRFPQVSEGVYRSSDYQTATNKVDVTIETGVTTIQVS